MIPLPEPAEPSFWDGFVSGAVLSPIAILLFVYALLLVGKAWDAAVDARARYLNDRPWELDA